ncbi:MAG: response regulator [Endomicrobium sp.]|jgi:YesN/AraC family two-component response regulator|nr:response regulator [Endomicrobium sp.]
MSVQKGRILIVDDEQGIRDLLISEFSKMGYEVFAVINGEEAAAKLRAKKIDIVITEMKMPRFDGLELLKFIKEKALETEVIIITGYAAVENALDAMRCGAYDFVQKPFNMDELVALVEKALEKTELKMLVALYESSNAVFSSLKLEDLFPIMTSFVKKVTHSQDASIFLLDNNNHLYPAYSTYSRYASQKNEIELLASKLCGENRTEPIFFDTSAVPKNLDGIFTSDTEIKSVIAFPMMLNKMMGYLLLTKTNSAYSYVKSDLKNAGVLAARIAQSIANTKLYEKLEVKIAELEQVLRNLDKVKDTAKAPESKFSDTALFISEQAEYIASLKDMPQPAVNALNEMKNKALQCLHETNQEQK